MTVASPRSRPPRGFLERPGESSAVVIPTHSVAKRPRRHAGFTLIEVMVVLVIMGVMATGITIGLDSLRGRDAEQALKRLRLVLEASADRAIVRGRPIAIEFLPDGYRFSALDADDNWRPLIDPPVFTERTLPGGLGWSGLRLEGQTEAAAPRLQFGSQAPEYELRVATPGGEARLTGKANGEVILDLPGRQRS